MPEAKPSAVDADAAGLLAAVVSSAPIVMFALDAEGVFTLSEGRGLEVLGLKPGEVVGRSVFELYKDYPQLLDQCRRALKGEHISALVPLGPLMFDTRFAPRLDWGGKVTGLLGVATDVSERYQASLARDEFLSTISHELRTPLSSASGWAWMLQEGGLSPAETVKAVETICRNLDDIKRLIQELRDASQSATGRLALKIKSCDLGEAVRQAGVSLSGAAKAKNQKLDIAARTLKGDADKGRVRQIAWILISNAVKHSPKGSLVSARLERIGGEAVLTVSDQGPGLAAAETAPRGRGFGFGLVIARRLVELHGGSLSFADGAEGGTVVTVRLPLVLRKSRSER